jgi:cation:H+ antiporter
MSADLTVAILVFLASAIAVGFLGLGLAKYGDALASLTGLGRMFVGSILVAFATSLPELSTNISAVRLDPPNPQLALGDVLGSNMLNLFIFAMVALVFGGRRFLQQVSPRQGYLMVLAATMTGGAVLLGAVGLDLSLVRIGVSSAILLAVYLFGMWVVYRNRASDVDAEDGVCHGAEISRNQAWVMFGLVSVGVIVAGICLAWSTDRVAEITGVASSTLGILAVSMVTSFPELSATLAAARMNAADLGVAGIFGSCVFNISILAYADPFYNGGVLVNQIATPHMVAGGTALGLILAALALVMGRNRLPTPVASAGLVLMIGGWLAAAIAVGAMGTA